MRKASVMLGEFLRIICVLALVMIGFAHKPLSAYPLDAQSSVYQLPDGTFASLCADDHGIKPHGTKGADCEACRLAGGILAPTPFLANGITVAFSTVVRVFERRQLLARALYPPSSGPRAPPASLMFA